MTSVAIASLAAGCSRDETLRCSSDTRYLSSRTVPPLSIPEDLTVPDETEALRIPEPLPAPPAPEEEEEGTGPCLETPPDFFEAQVPG